jgi:hypothetical protein
MSQFVSTHAVRALFASYTAADEDYQQAKAITEQKLKDRSDRVQQILNTLGKGPFVLPDGSEVQIVNRNGTFFFRNRNNSDCVVV